MTTSTVPWEPLLNLRIVVAALAEQHHDAWCRSEFLSPTGVSFLQRLYPRSAFAAAVRSAGRSARLVHDAKVGRGAVFHLYRLPPHLERGLDTYLPTHAARLAETYRPILADRDALLARLESLGEGQGVTLLPGPVRAPGIEEGIVEVIAPYYLAAFHEGAQVFPYVEAEAVES